MTLQASDAKGLTCNLRPRKLPRIAYERSGNVV